MAVPWDPNTWGGQDPQGGAGGFGSSTFGTGGGTGVNYGMFDWGGGLPTPSDPGFSMAPTMTTGGLMDPISLETTFAGRPSDLWRAARIGALSDRQALLPQFTRNLMAGYQPAYGRYRLADPAGGQTFAEFLRDAGGARALGTTDIASQNWQRAMDASRLLAAGNVDEEHVPRNLFAYQQALGGTGEDAGAARDAAIAMASSYMGAGMGYGGESTRRAIANLHDLYAARAEAAGQSRGGFINWLGQRYGGRPTDAT